MYTAEEEGWTLARSILNTVQAKQQYADILVCICVNYSAIKTMSWISTTNMAPYTSIVCIVHLLHVQHDHHACSILTAHSPYTCVFARRSHRVATQ